MNWFWHLTPATQASIGIPLLGVAMILAKYYGFASMLDWLKGKSTFTVMR